MNERSQLIQLCMKGMQEKGLTDEAHKNRLKKELKAIDEQAEHEYFLSLHRDLSSKKMMFEENQHNNLVDFLLGIAPCFDINQESAFVQGESPDIDIDYIREVRDYLKREWAPQEFGRDHVCSIGTYGTSGIKSAVLDMARVHNKDVHEIQSITSKLEDKDDEGKLLEWSKIFEIATFQVAGKEKSKEIREAIESDPDLEINWEHKYQEIKEWKLDQDGNLGTESVYILFANYCQENPEVASAAKLGIKRNRQSGVHAGGLIISNQPLDGFVPLEVRSVKKDNPTGDICSAWTEGMNAQDLQPVGLIKFDLLVINNLLQIALACNLVKERHGVKSICAMEGSWDWSDLSYLNDPKAIAMANRGDLKCIFQFDGDGMRKLAKRGGVTSFDDLPAYSSLYRPGPLNMGMDVKYCKRKKWSLNPSDTEGEPYSLHPVLQDILGNTYGVMCYQEQVMEILRAVGKIPDMHTEKVRKAISKKKIKQFAKYKDQFVENGQEVLGVNKEFVVDLWDQIESFAEYGFNKSHATAYAYISSRLLWLKAHYPLEFYAAILQCEKDTDRFHVCKLDAKNHDIEVSPVNINKSKNNFWIEDGKIYFGFQNIKGIGMDVAKRIVDSQPYKDFDDFLMRFGTDSTPIKALISLGVFDELEPNYSREFLRRYHEFMKDAISKRKQRKQRYEASMIKKTEELEEMLFSQVPKDDPLFETMNQFTDEAQDIWQERFSDIELEVPYTYKGEKRMRKVTFFKQLFNLSEKKKKSERNFAEKEKLDDENPRSLANFMAPVKLDEEELEVLRDEMIVDGHRTYPKAEGMYYGFQWNHILETSPDFNPDRTIDSFLEMVELQRDVESAPIQVIVLASTARKSKRGTPFWSLEIQDANGVTKKINIWQDDWIRFKEEFKKGNMLQLKVSPPSGGFNTFTLKSLGPKWKRKKIEKDQDYRVVMMKESEKILENETDLSNMNFDESALQDLL